MMFTVWLVSEIIKHTQCFPKSLQIILDFSMRNGFQKFNTDWTTTFITSNSKSDSFHSWLTWTLKLISTEVPERPLFCKSTRKFSIQWATEYMLRTGVKSRTSTHTDCSEKLMNIFCPNSPTWDFTPSRLLIQSFTRVEEESDSLMNQKTASLHQTVNNNLTFWFTFAMANFTLIEKISRPQTLRALPRTTGFHSLFQSSMWKPMNHTESSQNTSLPIIGVSGMLTESRKSESTMDFTLWDLEIFLLQLLYKINSSNALWESLDLKSEYWTISTGLKSMKSPLISLRLLTTPPENTSVPSQFSSTQKSLHTEDISNWFTWMKREPALIFTWDMSILRTLSLKTNGKESPTQSTLKKFHCLKTPKKTSLNGSYPITMMLSLSLISKHPPKMLINALPWLAFKDGISTLTGLEVNGFWSTENWSMTVIISSQDIQASKWLHVQDIWQDFTQVLLFQDGFTAQLKLETLVTLFTQEWFTRSDRHHIRLLSKLLGVSRIHIYWFHGTEWDSWEKRETMVMETFMIGLMDWVQGTSSITFWPQQSKSLKRKQKLLWQLWKRTTYCVHSMTMASALPAMEIIMLTTKEFAVKLKTHVSSGKSMVSALIAPTDGE